MAAIPLVISASVRGATTTLNRVNAIFNYKRMMKSTMAIYLASQALRYFVSGLEQAMNKMNKLVEFSYQLRIPVGEAAMLAEMFRRAGTSIEDMRWTFQYFQKAVARTPEVFKKIGINVSTDFAKTDTSGNVVKNKEGKAAQIETWRQVGLVAKALQKIENQAQRSSIQLQIFGRTATNTSQFLDDFSEHLADSARFYTESLKGRLTESSKDINRMSKNFAQIGDLFAMFYTGSADTLSKVFNPMAEAVLSEAEDWYVAGQKVGDIIVELFVILRPLWYLGKALVNLFAFIVNLLAAMWRDFLSVFHLIDGILNWDFTKYKKDREASNKYNQNMDQNAYDFFNSLGDFANSLDFYLPEQEHKKPSKFGESYAGADDTTPTSSKKQESPYKSGYLNVGGFTQTESSAIERMNAVSSQIVIQQNQLTVQKEISKTITSIKQIVEDNFNKNSQYSLGLC